MNFTRSSILRIAVLASLIACNTIHVELPSLAEGTLACEAWSEQTVREAGPGISTAAAFALGSDGTAHFFYVDRNASGSGLLAHDTLGSRETGVTDDRAEIDLSAAPVAAHAAVDAKGAGHLVIEDGASIIFASNASGAWRARRIGEGGRAAIVLDGQAHAHITYVTPMTASTQATLAIMYATNSTGDWHTERIASLSEAGTASPAIAVNGFGSPFVVFVDRASHALNVADERSGTWTIENIATLADGRAAIAVGANAVVVLDSTGLLHLKRMAGWETTQIAPNVDFTVGALAIDGHGTVHAAYTDGTHVTYATNAFGAFGTSVVALVYGAATRDTIFVRDVAVAVDATFAPRVASIFHTQSMDAPFVRLEYATSHCDGLRP